MTTLQEIHKIDASTHHSPGIETKFGIYAGNLAGLQLNQVVTSLRLSPGREVVGFFLNKVENTSFGGLNRTRKIRELPSA